MDEEARDVVQDAFLLAVRFFPDFRGDDECQFRAWLRGILMNQMRNRASRDARRPAEVHVQAEPRHWETPSWWAMLAEEDAAKQAILKQALESLEPADREFFALAYMEQFDWSRIGSRLECTPGAARMRHVRILRKVSRLVHRS
jgi:RNA polymerase sigma factor (sigma-70 family)